MRDVGEVRAMCMNPGSSCTDPPVCVGVCVCVCGVCGGWGVVYEVVDQP